MVKGADDAEEEAPPLRPQAASAVGTDQDEVQPDPNNLLGVPTNLPANGDVRVQDIEPISSQWVTESSDRVAGGPTSQLHADMLQANKSAMTTVQAEQKSSGRQSEVHIVGQEMENNIHQTQAKMQESNNDRSELATHGIGHKLTAAINSDSGRQGKESSMAQALQENFITVDSVESFQLGQRAFQQPDEQHEHEMQGVIQLEVPRTDLFDTNTIDEEPILAGQLRNETNDPMMPPPLDAEVFHEPVMAEVVDENEQKATAVQQLRRQIGLATIVFIAILAALIGGFCGSGTCNEESIETARQLEACGIVVDLSFDVLMTTYRLQGPLDNSPFALCEPLNGTVFPENFVCPFYSFDRCSEDPYKVQFVFKGGGCNESQSANNTGKLNFTCQDGFSGGPSNEIGDKAYITVHDVRQKDLVYFEKYVSTLEVFAVTNRGDDVGPDLLIRVYSSSNTEDPEALLQTLYYYSNCTEPHELFSTLGSVQLMGFSDGRTQVIRFDNTTVALEFNFKLDAFGTVLENNNGTITIDQVLLISSFTNPIVKKDLKNVTIRTRTETIDLFDHPIHWSPNQTNGRFTLRAEVQGTGPKGEACSGVGFVSFIGDYV